MSRPTITVVTWNLLVDDYRREERLSQAIRQLGDVDVLLVQEMLQAEGVEANLDWLAKQLGFAVASRVPYDMPGYEHTPGSAILTRLPIRQADLVIPTTDAPEMEPRGHAGAILEMPSGRLMAVASVHLPWGSHNGARRARHAARVDAWFTDVLHDLPNAIGVLGGDFNDLPDADTLRFLQGLTLAEAGYNTLWTDAWVTCGEGPGYTSDPRGNFNSARTAINSGLLDPTLIPPRRIDYLMVRGFAHGRPGCPVSADLVGGVPTAEGLHASDHYGIRARLWDPPLNA